MTGQHPPQPPEGWQGPHQEGQLPPGQQGQQGQQYPLAQPQPGSGQATRPGPQDWFSQPGQSGQPGRPTGGGQASGEPKGFFAALFDFRFHTLITPKIIKFVYAAMVVIGVLSLLFYIVAGFASDSPALGVLALIFDPILLIVWLAFIRMTLELYFAVVRMSDDVHRTFASEARRQP